MRIEAGRKNRLVTFYPKIVTEDPLGVESEVDGQPIRAWANVLFGSGQERRDAGQQGAVQAATFRVLSTAALREARESWEIEFNGARWGVTSIVPIGEADDIEFTATRRGTIAGD
jgi:head-tail adaptor